MVRLRDTKIYKILAGGCLNEISCECIKHVQSGKNINLRDQDTGETYLHLLAHYVERFRSPRGTSIIYIMASKGIDLDLADNDGDTFLHRIMREPRTYRAVIAVIRCGADPLVKNKDGLTPEDVLLQTKPEGWEETLHWYHKFTPGLYRAVTADRPDRVLVERLLTYFCRTSVVKNEKLVCLKTITKQNIRDLDLVMLLEKYENTIEFALALFTGKDLAVRYFFKDVPKAMDNIDINSKDHSYQYRYPEYPEVPLPILAALWEGNMEENIAILLEMGVDTSVLFSYNPEVEPPKPLFFQVVCGVVKPTDSIVHRVLEASDMSARNPDGQTIVYEAIARDCPDAFIVSLIKYGANIASRDQYGRTARDYAEFVKKPRYCKLIDACVLEMVRVGDVRWVESLLRYGYDHLMDVVDTQTDMSIEDVARDQGSPQINKTLGKAGAVKDHTERVFDRTKAGDLNELQRLMGNKYGGAVDRCGRTVLHIAVIKGRRDIVIYLSNSFPQLLNAQDNLGRTPVHYAQLFMEGDAFLSTMTRLGDKDIMDVKGRTNEQYHPDVCGEREFAILRRSVQEMAMEVFLSQTQFDRSIQAAIQNEDLEGIQSLLCGLKPHGDINRYSTLLFSCIELGKESAAIQLIKEGLSTDIFKQYEECDPGSTECALCECNHTVTSFRDKAEKLKRRRVVQLLDQIEKVNHKNNAISPKATPAVSNFEKFGIV